MQHVFLFTGGVVRLASQQAQQFNQILHIGFGGFALQRIEAGRLPALQCQVGAAAGTHENLGPAVLVEEEDGGLGTEFLCLGQQEVDQRRLAGA